MRRLVGVIVVLSILFLGLGMLLPFITQGRAKADRARCQELLRRLAMQGPGHYAQQEKAFPAGTMVANLPPERRLSWLPAILVALGRGDLAGPLDPKIAWDAPPNQSIAETPLTFAICPALAPREPIAGFAPLHYVGCAVVG